MNEDTDNRLPHPIEVEVEARRTILRSYAYKISDPERLAAAYRVVARNRSARELATPRAWVVA